MTTPRPRRAGERVFACLLLLGSAFLLWTSIGISGFASYASAGSFPMAASATMLVCALIVLAQTIKAAPIEVGSADASPLARFLHQIMPPTIVWTVVAIAVYMLALERVGFIVASYLFLLVTMRLLGSTRWGINLLASAVMLAGIYVIFQTAFSVVLPEGSLWQGVFR